MKEMFIGFTRIRIKALNSVGGRVYHLPFPKYHTALPLCALDCPSVSVLCGVPPSMPRGLCLGHAGLILSLFKPSLVT